MIADFFSHCCDKLSCNAADLVCRFNALGLFRAYEEGINAHLSNMKFSMSQLFKDNITLGPNLVLAWQRTAVE